MFIDASAIVAILAGEPDAEDLAARIEAAPRRTSSVVSLFEAVSGLSRMMQVDEARRIVERFVSFAEVEVLAVDGGLLPGLAAAHAAYGKGSGHPARLNMGDCYSYALAKQNGLPLLYKGDDFAQTDIA
ncbi:type II toxin-antitoxin system VapC family toxin [Antarcticirhabdus aurantiaca]|uniref:Type II toxin-antitoxin system VapC family toxin n=1 Tax=Antarcticirhabdus aurantiaca TaxID=2606717 RepID=A0ACD4NI62_9HYPH|nr:type II toxin-antitoxin system VapC family toxin [Antarcticirhabdus aurantiaca]WAJ26483.1 type II toxin-antitoxin system VapC family toxin [Jeongeuplla avenae]